MVKKVAWPWLIGALSIGWYIGNEPAVKTQPPVLSTNISEPIGVTISLKTDRVQKFKKQPVSRPTRSLKSVTPKSKTINLAKEKPIPLERVSNTRIMYVDASRLKVRNSPDKKGRQVWTLKRDEKVTVTNKKDEWLFVKGARYQGWVFGAYLTPKKSPASLQTPITPPNLSKPKLSSAKVKQILIDRSISLYSGSCPCPYNVTRGGSRCGGRSAYSRPGGASPICYPRDISESMVAAYLARQ